ncbi:MAG TPA: HPr(Ser) kinase/phosphatase, partial [Chthoniobacterales bacterium]
MTRSNTKRIASISVGHFYANHAAHLSLRLEGASKGMSRPIREPTINRPGLALMGFYSYFAAKRIQVIGAAELSYLRSLEPEILATRLQSLFARS